VEISALANRLGPEKRSWMVDGGRLKRETEPASEELDLRVSRINLH
jgi:hypothetical protein